MQTIDLARPTKQAELRKHKLKRLIPSNVSYFNDVKCGNCYRIQTIFSHCSSVVHCSSCNNVLARPTGGKSALENDSQFRRKGN